LFSALAIELARFGTTQPLPFAYHILKLVAECYRAVSNTNFVCPDTHQSRQVLYADSAVISAVRTWKYFSDVVARRSRLVELQEAERANMQQQHQARERAAAQVARDQAEQEAQAYYEHKLRILRAQAASNLLWSRHNAAIAIQM